MKLIPPSFRKYLFKEFVKDIDFRASFSTTFLTVLLFASVCEAPFPLYASSTGSMLPSGNCCDSTYSVSVRIPDMPDSTLVVMYYGDESIYRNPKTEKLSAKGECCFSGSVDRPVLATIHITDPRNESVKAIEFMIENTGYTISSPSLDSIPESWYTGKGGKLKEKNIKIEGGEAQREFQDFREAMFPYELDVKDSHFKAYGNRKKGKPVDRRLDSLYRASQARLSEYREGYVQSHPCNIYSMKLLSKKLNFPFTLSHKDVDTLVMKVKDSRWIAERDLLLNKAESYRDVATPKKYTDIEFTDADGKIVKLSECCRDGKYLFIDFWASWCGPCRAAIPKIAEMYRKYGDKVNFISVSIDADPALWEAAVKEESMPWKQFIAKEGDQHDMACKAFHFKAIPTLILINPDNEIIYESASPELIKEKLKNEI